MKDRQRQIYDFIQTYIEENKYSPSMREITAGVGLKSVSTVHEHLDRMRKNGYIDFVDSRSRTISILEYVG